MIDTLYWKQGIQRLCGIDEAGRGPLAGPCVVAAVMMPPNVIIKGVNDSKKLSAKKREALASVIKEIALAYHIEVVDEATIDTDNIYQATKHAMMKAAQSLNAEFTLTDAMPLGPFIAHESIIKGDQKSHTIAAASILAKVTRDAYMGELAINFPDYGFEKHKGYATKAHLEALKTYGPTPHHRRSFAPVSKGLKNQPTLFDDPHQNHR